MYGLTLVRRQNFKPPTLTVCKFTFFDPQTSVVPLWKDIDPVVDIISAQETDIILKIGFGLQK